MNSPLESCASPDWSEPRTRLPGWIGVPCCCAMANVGAARQAPVSTTRTSLRMDGGSRGRRVWPSYGRTRRSAIGLPAEVDPAAHQDAPARHREAEHFLVRL